VLTIVDIAMLNAIAFDVLAPGLVRLAVPSQRLEIVATGVNASISSLWILLDPSFDCTATQQATSPTTVGEVAVDLAHLMIGDFAALASWRSDHSENDFENVPHDVVFWGKDASGLATLLNASDHRDGFGWVNLTEKLAEQKMNSIARRKQDHGWQLTIEQQSDTHLPLRVVRAVSTKTGSCWTPPQACSQCLRTGAVAPNLATSWLHIKSICDYVRSVLLACHSDSNFMIRESTP
jgi:hypothetical protein